MRFIFSSFCLFFTLTAQLSSICAQAQVIKDKNPLEIRSPSLQKQKTLKLRLDNELEVYIVSDPEANQSGAALSVAAGTWNDPEEFPGTAHFLEHMLFLGTSKYPKEGEFSTFVTEHGGTTNAYTAADHTNYMFSVDNQAFAAALDRFSWFFKEPLFNPSGVQREMQAVDQEHSKNVEDDMWRRIYVQKALSNQQHPYSRFGAGNYSTLEKISQDTLKEWYAENYSSNLMKLAIYSSLGIDALKELVIEYFSSIKNQSLTKSTWDMPMLAFSRQAHLVSITPV